VVDCSAAVVWYLEDEANKDSERLLAAVLKDGAIVPCLWRTEFVNMLVMAERHRRLTAAKRREILRDAESLPISVDQTPPPLARLADLAAEYRLTAYDAAYLELVQRLALPLATQDRDLIKAAKVCGVSLF
jgi:predicted nucleic acid-binding protein